MGEFRNSLKVAATYTASIIGAGFASGRELLQFFSNYQRGGFYGIILAGVLFALIGGIVLERVYTCRIRNYSEFLFPAVGSFLGRIMEILVMFFMLSLLVIMVSGLANVLSSFMGAAYGLCAFLVSVACFVVILNGVRGVSIVGAFVTPVLIIGIFLAGLYIIVFKEKAVYSMSGILEGSGVLGWLTGNWIFSSLLYVSYNSIISVVVMCNMLPLLKTKRAGVAGGVMGGIVLCLAALVLNHALSLFYPGVSGNEIPILGILAKFGAVLHLVYSLVLGLAMFVSAVTSGFCFCNEFSNCTGFKTLHVATAACLLAIPLSGFGFSRLIAVIYPVFGYFGMLIIFVILGQSVQYYNND